MNQLGFIQESQRCFSICKSINVKHHSNKREKPCDHPNRHKKSFDKFQYPFMTKTLIKVHIEGPYLNIINGIYDKVIANIILNDEKLNAFSLNSRTRQGNPHSPLVFNIVLEALVTAIRQ